MALEQLYVLEIGLPHDVEDVAEQRHRPDQGVDRDVGGDAYERRTRRAETNGLDKDPSGEQRTGGVSEARDEAEDGVEAEANGRPRYRDSGVQPEREAPQPR